MFVLVFPSWIRRKMERRYMRADDRNAARPRLPAESAQSAVRALV
jgi:hypothetical protein